MADENSNKGRSVARLNDWLHGFEQSVENSWRSIVGRAAPGLLKPLKKLGGSGLSSAAEQFSRARPFIEAAGYDVRGVDMSVGFSPRFIAYLDLREVLTLEERTALLQSAEGKPVVKSILQALLEASAARDNLPFEGMVFTGVELDLSVLPAVTLKFTAVQDDA